MCLSFFLAKSVSKIAKVAFRLEEHTTASRDGGCVLTRFDAVQDIGVGVVIIVLIVRFSSPDSWIIASISQADVSKLEDVCLSQHLRIQQLELQVRNRCAAPFYPCFKPHTVTTMMQVRLKNITSTVS